MPSTMKKPFNYVENAAVTAAVKRARTGQPAQIGPDPALHSQDAELHWVEAVLRHRLSLRSLNRPVRGSSQGEPKSRHRMILKP
uniref:hypothetical protein n=1 Tax=Streptomyces sp. F8 TaxID=1436085 RepID=UPI0003D89007|nr:hypothetical protein [Streptomyces sp. F8]AHE39702.1 Hypothetical protein pFRL5_39 [Streptomyces sp. F8]